MDEAYLPEYKHISGKVSTCTSFAMQGGWHLWTSDTIQGIPYGVT